MSIHEDVSLPVIKYNGRFFKTKCVFSAYVTNAEIRKVVLVQGKYSQFLQITALDTKNDEIAYLLDRNIGNIEKYKKGTVGCFKLQIDYDDEYRGRTRVYVADFAPYKKEAEDVKK